MVLSFQYILVIGVNGFISALQHIHPYLPLAYEALVECFFGCRARAHDVLDAFILQKVFHHFPSEFMRKFKALNGAFFLQITGVGDLRYCELKLCQSILVVLKALFPSDILFHVYCIG